MGSDGRGQKGLHAQSEGAMSAVEHWRNRVETHHAQSIRVQEQGEPAGDFWRPFASAFRVDPHRTDDPVLNALRRDLDSSATLIDVGGGAGRFALPLALACRHVTVVEPSESMRERSSNKGLTRRA